MARIPFLLVCRARRRRRAIVMPTAGSDCGRLGLRQRRRLYFSLRQLQTIYHLPLKQAAQRLGVCEAALKRICRRHGILKWPYRQLSSVERRIADLRAARSPPTELESDGSRHRRQVSLVDNCASRSLRASTDTADQLGDSAQISPARFKTKASKMRALVDEHRRIIRSAHLEQDSTPPFVKALPNPQAQRKRLADGTSTCPSPSSLLALASACEIHTAARQIQRRQHECSFQTARLLGLIPPHSALHGLAAVASRAPRALEPAAWLAPSETECCFLRG